MYFNLSVRAHGGVTKTKQIIVAPVIIAGVLLCLAWVVYSGLRGAFLCVGGVFLALLPSVALWGLYGVVVWVAVTHAM